MYRVPWSVDLLMRRRGGNIAGVWAVRWRQRRPWRVLACGGRSDREPTRPPPVCGLLAPLTVLWPAVPLPI